MKVKLHPTVQKTTYSAHQKFGDNISSSYYVTLQNHVLWNVKIPMHVQAIK